MTRAEDPRDGVALLAVIVAVLLLWVLAVGVSVMTADGQRQAMNLGESNGALYVAESGLEWSIKAGSSTTGFSFAGGTFTVSRAGQPGDVAAESASGSPTVEIYLANVQRTVTGLVGRAKRVIVEGSNTTRSNASSLSTDGAASGIAAGDLDGDGDKDLVFGTTNGKLQVFLNGGTATFTQQGSSPYSANSEVDSVGLADLDGDGDLDIVCVDRGSSPYKLEVWKNNGSAVFTQDATYSLGGKGDCLSLGDVKEDANGDVDVVVGTEANQFEVWTNNGSGTLTLSATLSVNDGTVPHGIVLSDVDVDGDNDVMLVTEGKNMEKWLNNGSGGFSYSASYSLNKAGFAIAAANFNGSAGEDMLVGEKTHRFETFVNNGSGTFTRDQMSAAPPGDVYAVALYDMDGDGDLDAVLGEVGTDGIELYYNNGSGTFTLDSAFTTGGPVKAAVAMDFYYAG